MTKVGIQGGRGSANEEACFDLCTDASIGSYDIKYLVKTERVLRALHDGEIDLGVFAVSSTNIGTVAETDEAIKVYGFEKVNEINMPIDHLLLALTERPRIKDYVRLVSHPQAIKMHMEYFNRYCPTIELIGGDDTGTIAGDLAEGRGMFADRAFAEDTLVLGLESCIHMYGLKVIKNDLPGNKGSSTLFYLVKKAE